MTAREVAWEGLEAWFAEIGRLHGIWRYATEFYERYQAAARALTAARIRACADLEGLRRLERILLAARHPNGFGGLDTVWGRAELGELIVAAEGRRKMLEAGRILARPKGPRLDPAWLPDERLEALIQTHRNLAFVDALRAERRRRTEGRP